MKKTKVCNTCEIEKPVSEFNTNGWNDGDRTRPRKYHAHCKPCMSKQVADRHHARLEEIIGGKLKCSNCGYDKHPCAIDFHHLDPSKKEAIPSRLRDCSFERIKKEIDKCVMLCANCHRLVHNRVIDINPL